MLVPKLRFKREDGTDFPEWEEKELKNVATILMGQSPSGNSVNAESNGVPLVQGKADILGYGVIPDRYTSTPTKVSEPNDIIMTVRAPVGFVAKLGFVACIGRGVCAIRANENEDYICYVLQNKESEWKYIEQGSTFTAVNSDDVSSLIVPIPCLEEQKKIADFLSTVDEVIAQSKAEVQNLEQQKKAAMQKIFSQEVRFKREYGTEYPEWEEKTLQDVSFYITTTGIGEKSVYVGTENMRKDCSGVVLEDNNDTTVKGIQYAINDVLVSNIRPYLKKAWKADRSGICSTDVLCIRGTSGVLSEYLYTLLSSDSFFEYVMQGVKGTKMPRGDKKHIMDMPVSIPCLEEQQKIADFLSAYDEAISYAKQELDRWKELKKGLLQQMFV